MAPRRKIQYLSRTKRGGGDSPGHVGPKPNFCPIVSKRSYIKNAQNLNLMRDKRKFKS